MSAVPVAPMPVAAVNVAVPLVTRLASSRSVLSVMAPAVAVSAKLPDVLVSSDSAIEVAAV